MTDTTSVPESSRQGQGRPEDLDAWWDTIDDELASIPANPERTFQPLQSSAGFSDAYRVRFTSIGNYPIAAWLTIPKGDGPFPTVLTVPNYASVVTPAHYDLRQRFVTMTVMTRGQRGADKPYAAAFPGHLTNGISSPDTWIMRGVMADLLRAYEVLTALPQVDQARIGITGTDAGLLLAARRPGAAAVQVTAGFWYRLAEQAAATEAYPFEEINDYLRTWPDQREAVLQTVSYVDPQYQANKVNAAIQINRDQDGKFASDAWLAPLVASLAPDIAYYDIEHRGQADHDANDVWLSDQLGAQPAPRQWEPQEIGSWS